MTWRGVLYAVLGAGVIAAGAAWWLHTYKRESQQIDLPRTGEAARNPLHGLRLVLERYGADVRAWRRLDPRALALGPRDTLVYDGDLRELPAATVDALRAWLHDGGHLVVTTPPSVPAADIVQHARRVAAGEAEPHIAVPLLDALGVRARLRPGRCIDASDAGGWAPLFCTGRRFESPPGAIATWGDARDGDVLARVRMPGGQGIVDVLASADVLSTDELQRAPNTAIARQLFTPLVPGGTVHLVHASRIPSLWRLLLVNGAPVWIPLALLLALWLWARARRFGPLLESPSLERRSLLEHVAASGEHQWRYGHGDALHAAMRDAFLARLRRRDPQGAALAGEAQVQHLVERLRLPATRIRDALSTPDRRDGPAVFARIATLVHMRNRL